MLAIAGTIPDKELPLIEGEVILQDGNILISNTSINVNRGTAALLGAAVRTLEFLNCPLPYAYLVGDTGLGEGSRRMYGHLTEELPKKEFSVVTFHYAMPDIDWFNKIIIAVDHMKQRPLLVADAGSMYAAKMSGQSSVYELFTPDSGELAFLADEEAPHPFYTRGFILHEDNASVDLIKRAYANNNAAKYLLVKGSTDYIASKNEIISSVNSPEAEAMEAIGGTGDTITGIVSGLMVSGMETADAAVAAAKVNRLAGLYADPTPATQVISIIEQIPRALKEILS
ncbi:MAG: NAD(P)H-hydrate dehydratase [Dissulfurispiraceae bacterium]|jgi:NAD(P)H-hydrate repair Nnr-like enzyme with NAD(P)H-hydrate dehydratase domain|nr:NAD(P)H-hydrate dehydratase [Dissulfurispiraceae bacterium]